MPPCDCGLLDVAFPLTPALSLAEEREAARQPLVQAVLTVSYGPSKMHPGDDL